MARDRPIIFISSRIDEALARLFIVASASVKARRPYVGLPRYTAHLFTHRLYLVDRLAPAGHGPHSRFGLWHAFTALAETSACAWGAGRRHPATHHRRRVGVYREFL